MTFLSDEQEEKPPRVIISTDEGISIRQRDVQK
jgi:hypothetical protein